ncbi:LIM domain-containing protein [Lasiodiplodia theobromae]|uniref:LIM domain-containing protein n=1 Tax=Lasiodiplodia theobromae TaxID=45133 RepID=A0A5N5D333_9PEZI|nr:LIM domain-containing protein [Lasiodiplodia theobromae]
MLSRSRSKDKGSNIPGPTYMNNEQVGNFLSNIRNNRPQRPNGSRPLPASPMGSLRSSRTFGSATPEPRDPPTLTPTKSQPPRSTSALSHRDMFSSSNNSRGSLRERLAPRAASSLGRPLVRDPFTRSTSRNSQKVDPATIERADSRTSSRSTSGEQRHAYRESGARWMERQEAASLRKALEDMDAAEEQRIFAAAQDEAAELVWKHQNPKAAIRSPDAPYEYTAHLKKGSHARAQSYDAPSPQSSASGRNSSLSSRGSSSSSVKVHDFVIAKKSDKLKSKKDTDAHPSKAMESPMQSPTKSHVSFDVPSPRRRSSGSKRKLSGSLFQNPNDKIYEEPEESASPPAEQKPTPPSPSKLPIHTRRNPFSRIQFGRDNLTRSNTDSQATPQKRFDRFEIHRNEPTQSRNPAYTSNENAPVTPTQARNPAASSPEESPVKMKDGKEIRADDIRAATSMRLKDRSPKLPTPSMVSDSPGRPIVSFQKDYKPKEVALKEEQAKAMVEMKSPEASHEPKSYPPSPPKSASAPVVPTINMPDEPFGKKRSSAIPPIPEINVPDETPRPRSRGSAAAAPIPSISVGGAPSVPSINVSDPPSINVSGGSARPLPTINAPSSGSARPLPDPRSARNGRPLPRTANTAPSTMPKGHWTPSGGVRTSALCESCALPIAGRTVSAGGARFHPECFRCYHCSEALECVAFYPEPQGKREERLDRIYRRRNGEDVEIMEGYSENDDGDEGLRFYCHLDYHEFFSPRCKSCKTPIEGEVIVACGAEWHAGHFFCAECGDPFDSSTPFVEKDGYAWCVNCHTNRYSTKCKKCRKPVTDTVLKALGFEWHPNCFVCTECSGEFVDGRYFLRGEEKNPVCVKCEERRLKA